MTSLLESILKTIRRALGPQHDVGADLEQAIALHEAGQLEEAAERYRALLDREPRNADAIHLLGLIAHQRGNQDAAIGFIDQAILIDPARAVFHFNLGNARAAGGDSAGAAKAFTEAVRLDPEHARAWFNLGRARSEAGEIETAAWAFRRALAADPESGPAALELAQALTTQPGSGLEGRLDEAISLLERHWHQADEPPVARQVLITCLERRGRFSEATGHYRDLAAENPADVGLELGLANCFNQLGRMEEALVHYHRARELAPDRADIGSSLLACLNYDPSRSPADIRDEHRDWGTRHAGLERFPAHPDDGDAARRLRIGYVSADLRRHPVGAMLAPVLERHDPRAVETFCFYNFPSSDMVTARLRAAAHHWHDISALSDAEAAQHFHDARIDILVDLAGHTTYNRLLAFARKPAPVQVSWLGYFSTTGVDAIDWLVTDPHSSPPGQDAYFTERLLRLPHTRFCYEPWEFMPAVNALPALAGGVVTFGSFNNLGKLNPRVLSAWAKILSGVPSSRLVIQASALGDAPNRERFGRICAEAGIAADRTELRPFAPLEKAALGYHEIDIALDPFPFCGGMTSFEALWMGVPVVTLAGEMIAGRQTASMLHNLGMSDLVAANTDDYVAIALRLANDLPRLAALRAGLRPGFAASPLADYAAFARALESAFGEMWRRREERRA